MRRAKPAPGNAEDLLVILGGRLPDHSARANLQTARAHARRRKRLVVSAVVTSVRLVLPKLESEGTDDLQHQPRVLTPPPPYER
jgi:hypothetical protein